MTAFFAAGSARHAPMSEKNGEIFFSVEQALEGGYVARALGHSIVTEADGLDALRASVREAVRCHFGEGGQPKVIRLQLLGQEDPFSCFEEWASEADSNGYGPL
jgi:hypothetical protein